MTPAWQVHHNAGPIPRFPEVRLQREREGPEQDSLTTTADSTKTTGFLVLPRREAPGVRTLRLWLCPLSREQMAETLRTKRLLYRSAPDAEKGRAPCSPRRGRAPWAGCAATAPHQEEGWAPCCPREQGGDGKERALQEHLPAQGSQASRSLQVPPGLRQRLRSRHPAQGLPRRVPVPGFCCTIPLALPAALGGTSTDALSYREGGGAQRLRSCPRWGWVCATPQVGRPQSPHAPATFPAQVGLRTATQALLSSAK